MKVLKKWILSATILTTFVSFSSSRTYAVTGIRNAAVGTIVLGAIVTPVGGFLATTGIVTATIEDSYLFWGPVLAVIGLAGTAGGIYALDSSSSDSYHFQSMNSEFATYFDVSDLEQTSFNEELDIVNGLIDQLSDDVRNNADLKVIQEKWDSNSKQMLSIDALSAVKKVTSKIFQTVEKNSMNDSFVK